MLKRKMGVRSNIEGQPYRRPSVLGGISTGAVKPQRALPLPPNRAIWLRVFSAKQFHSAQTTRSQAQAFQTAFGRVRGARPVSQWNAAGEPAHPPSRCKAKAWHGPGGDGEEEPEPWPAYCCAILYDPTRHRLLLEQRGRAGAPLPRAGSQPSCKLTQRTPCAAQCHVRPV